MIKHPRILVPPTHLQFFVKFLGMDSQGFSSNILYHEASLTESNNLFELQKISTGKNFASRNSAYSYFTALDIYLLTCYFFVIPVVLEFRVLNFLMAEAVLKETTGRHGPFWSKHQPFCLKFDSIDLEQL